MTVIAGEHVWTHDGTFDDIIAYRIIPDWEESCSN